MLPQNDIHPTLQMVREHLEYAYRVWSPIKKTDAKHIEKVESRATKVVLSIRYLLYRERLQHVKLPRLVYRRKGGDIIQAYRILYGLEDIPDNSLLKPAEDRL